MRAEKEWTDRMAQLIIFCSGSGAVWAENEWAGVHMVLENSSCTPIDRETSLGFERPLTQVLRYWNVGAQRKVLKTRIEYLFTNKCAASHTAPGMAPACQNSGRVITRASLTQLWGGSPGILGQSPGAGLYLLTTPTSVLCTPHTYIHIVSLPVFLPLPLPSLYLPTVSLLLYLLDMCTLSLMITYTHSPLTCWTNSISLNAPHYLIPAFVTLPCLKSVL